MQGTEFQTTEMREELQQIEAGENHKEEKGGKVKIWRENRIWREYLSTKLLHLIQVHVYRC